MLGYQKRFTLPPYPNRVAVFIRFMGAVIALAATGLSLGCFTPPGPPPSFTGAGPKWTESRVTPDATEADKRYIEVNWLHKAAEKEVVPRKPVADSEAMQLTLEQAINYAIVHNRGLRNSLDGARSSHYTLLSARSAFEVKVKPSGSIEIDKDGETHNYGVDVSRKFSPGTVVSSGGGMSRTGDNAYGSSVDVGVSQPLLRGFGREVNLNPVISAEREVQGRLRSFELRKEDVVLSVARAYYQVMRQRAVVLLNEQSEKRVERLLEMSRARQRIGLTNKLDVLRAEIQLAQARDSLESARKSLLDAEDDLKLQLALNPDAQIDLIGKLSYTILQITEKSAVEAAHKNRLDLYEAHDRIKDSRRLIRVARNDVLPDLDLRLGYTWAGSGDTVSSGTRLNGGNWSVGVSTSTDLWHTSERAVLEQRRIDLRVRQRSYEDLRDQIIQEVRQQLRTLKENRARIDIQLKNMAQAQQKLQLARLQFVKGLADNFDIIDAEQDLIRAENSYINVVTDYILSEFQLRRAMGTLTQKPEYLKS